MMKAIRTVTTQVRRIEAAGDDIMLLDLADPDDWELPPFDAGNHIDLHLPNGLVRSYSLCGARTDSRRYQVAIKREETGRGGSIAAHALRPGDTVPVSLPRGTFRVAADAREHLFIAGGIGITPFVAMAAQLGPDVPFSLHVLHRGAPPLAALCEAMLPREHVHYHRSGDGRPRVDLAALIGPFHAGRHVYCCGPDALMDAVADLTRDWPDGHVHIEHFVPPERPLDPDAKPYQVTLSVSNKSFDVLPNASLLDTLRQHDIEVDAACEGGICGACRVRWIDGQPVHHDRVLTDAEREREVIVCVSGCASARLVLAL
ncbi:PDR/VanB family oxidoreductase [Paraburkholderia sp.]|uniref:PDR/VanB family oxidoreductase n=1 Tax=Paraburkholderia sp. TaxID=1926495 RepID=UPI0023A3CB80|nr:PDR/VanB family oxidoreductase [Paraburkholderia sp.]MDE1182166.1 PDR/VanB family oxidoreductase [Paraburkholderia sp.]